MKRRGSRVKDQGAGLSIGVDLEKISRFRIYDLGAGRFWQNIFGSREIEYLKKYKDPYPHAAGMFCAKEAIRKSLAYFFRKASFRDVEINYGLDGRPLARISKFKNLKCQVSITHSGEYALAVALCFLRK